MVAFSGRFLAQNIRSGDLLLGSQKRSQSVRLNEQITLAARSARGPLWQMDLI